MAVQVGEKIYVLHAFQKKSPKGVKTAKPDIELIKQRYKEAQELKQREIAALLGIPQGEVSHLMNAHYKRFTTDKLLDFLKRLDLAVTISIRPHRAGEPYQEVRFAGPVRPARPPTRLARLEPARKRRKPVAA
jgi:predicted XRE-type DNA-binding protein